MVVDPQEYKNTCDTQTCGRTVKEKIQQINSMKRQELIWLGEISNLLETCTKENKEPQKYIKFYMILVEVLLKKLGENTVDMKEMYLNNLSLQKTISTLKTENQNYYEFIANSTRDFQSLLSHLP